MTKDNSDISAAGSSNKDLLLATIKSNQVITSKWKIDRQQETIHFVSLASLSEVRCMSFPICLKNKTPKNDKKLQNCKKPVLLSLKIASFWMQHQRNYCSRDWFLPWEPLGFEPIGLWERTPASCLWRFQPSKYFTANLTKTLLYLNTFAPGPSVGIEMLAKPPQQSIAGNFVSYTFARCLQR